MAQSIIAGPGQLLPYPGGLYPVSLLNGAPFGESTNEIGLAPGDALQIPAGDWLVGVGKYSFLQFRDPVTGLWRGFSSARVQPVRVRSDGFNFRVANMTGCSVAAIVTAGGSGYAQATTTVTPSTGSSVWQPIIGGLINTTVTIGAAGSGYTIPPLVFISAPPGPVNGVIQGVQATAVATISGGAVTAITVTNQGAGYLSAPTVTIQPSPFDPNFGAIVGATATLTLTGAGTLAAVVCTNPSVATAAAPTLTVAGAGSSATATPVWINSLISGTVGTAGAGYANTSLYTTIGGVPSATPTHANPLIELNAFVPRAALVSLTASGGAITTVGAITDGGLFAGTPTGLILSGSAPTTVGAITGTFGGVNDSLLLVQC